MNFYDKIHETVRAFRQTEEFKEFLKLKEEIKKDEKLYAMLKDFKDKQKEHQMKYLSGNKIEESETQNMQNLYSIIVQNEKARKLLECEMKLDVMLADLQKIIGDGIKEIVEF